MKEINNNLVIRAGEHSFEDNPTTNKGRLKEKIKGRDNLWTHTWREIV